jgi:hypothetical protein
MFTKLKFAAGAVGFLYGHGDCTGFARQRARDPLAPILPQFHVHAWFSGTMFMF